MAHLEKLFSPTIAQWAPYEYAATLCSKIEQLLTGKPLKEDVRAEMMVVVCWGCTYRIMFVSVENLAFAVGKMRVRGVEKSI
jgi:hypothetical protein